MVGLTATSSKRAYAAPRSAAQSPCPCGRPLLTCSSAADTQMQFWLSLCGVPGSWCAQGMFEPSECLWWKWGLILNANSPLLLSCWGFSFALGHGVNIYIFLNICCPIMLLLPWRYSKLSRVRLFATPWTVAHRASLSMGFSRQDYQSGLLCPPPGDLPEPGTKPLSPVTPARQVDSLLLKHTHSIK